MAESGLRFLLALLGVEEQAEMVVGGLQARVDRNRKAQRLLGLAVAAQVVQRHAEVLVSEVRHGDARQRDGGAIRRHRLLPSTRLRERGTEVEMSVGELRIDLDRALKMLDGEIRPLQLEVDQPEEITIDGDVAV